MLNAAAALHNAARRYCMDQHAFWSNRYAELSQSAPEDVRRGIYPRYQVLDAILTEIERFTPPDFADETSARALLVMAGETAQNVFTRGGFGPVGDAAACEERKRFVEFIQPLDLEVARSAAPLFYRRVLSAGEAEAIRRQMNERWQIRNGYWYPLDVKPPLDIEAFESWPFMQEQTCEKLRSLLRVRGIERIWEIREGEPHYELDVAVFEPLYNGLEGFWSSSELDWVAYASHEASVTIGGWLLQELKAIWPEWEQRRYKFSSSTDR